MNFLEDIFASLERVGDTIALSEIRDGRMGGVSGRALLEQVARARRFLADRRIKRGERCALYAANGVRWVAMDLAAMAEGLIVVPLYSRQAPVELVAMMKDCSPALVCCEDAGLRDGIAQLWAQAPPQCLLEEVFATEAPARSGVKVEVVNSDPVTILYTSGTSGEAKGVALSAGNIGHMLRCVNGQLDL